MFLQGENFGLVCVCGLVATGKCFNAIPCRKNSWNNNY